MLDLQDVSYQYRGKFALDGITLRIEQGGAVAFIGPNGSGKSTLFKLMNGLLFPSRGRYRFDSEEITEDKLKDVAFSRRFHQRIGFVFQNPDTQLFCSSVQEEIAFGPHQMGLAESDVNRRVEDCLELLQIKKLRGEHPWNLSGGEKKRVAIAAVLAMNPDVLVLDEPMNGIDPKGKAFLRELLLRLHASGKTIVAATHDFAYVEGIFRRAVVLTEDHRLVRDDEAERVMSDSVFLKQHNIM
ncbi:energy-coupling factor ABC transporter ATP-binding protein [Gorillibacterium timonense]|uniref:energy-coupling factor ABC transporter ATP-binding protein n=1 Tax=Gorillibacterium timonense TaxID=1689269 RepID=UPI00071E4827|nr:ABC transporter ATP-binding protein [Gorillibacterium timonense]